MGTPLRVLVVEDSDDDTTLLLRELQRQYDPTYERVQTAQAMGAALAGKPWDIVISDFNIPNFSALAALELLQHSGIDLPFIIVSGCIGEDDAVAAMKAGAHDALIKGNLKRLIPSIERELREADVRRERKRLDTTFRAIMESAPDAIVLVNREGRIVLHNPQTERLFGYTRDELLTQPIEILLPERFRGAHVAHRTGYSDNPHVRPMDGAGRELSGRRKDGSEFPVEISLSPVQTENERLVMSIIRDITPRKQAEAEQARLLRVLESSVNEIYMFEAETLRFEYVNRGAQRNLGYSLEQLRGMTPADLKPLITEVAFRELVRPLLNGSKEALIFETVHRRANGSLYPVEVHLQLAEQGGQRVFVAIILDVTERKRNEEELRRTGVFLNSIIENIPHMIFIKEAQTLRFIRFNKAGEKLLGYSRDDLIGKNDYDFFPKEQAEFFTTKDRQVLNDGTLTDIAEEPIQTRYQGMRILHTKKIPIYDEEGTPLYLMGISEDITERKKTDEQNKKDVEELARFNRLAIGRELRMVDLKEQINDLSQQLGKAPPYRLSDTQKDET
jgi:PAS domain S-box-containing protein